MPRSELAAYVEGRAGAGTWAWEALRVAAAVPRIGHETDHRTIPQEVGWVPAAVHLDKGCYRGQETVARVHNLGRPPRRLVQLHLDGSADRTPSVGDPVLASAREVGRITSIALHHELGPVALAVVKRSVPVDAELVVGPDDVTFGRREPGNSGRPVTRGDGVRRRRAETMTREGTSYDREDRSCRTRL